MLKCAAAVTHLFFLYFLSRAMLSRQPCLLFGFYDDTRFPLSNISERSETSERVSNDSSVATPSRSIWPEGGRAASWT